MIITSLGLQYRSKIMSSRLVLISNLLENKTMSWLKIEDLTDRMSDNDRLISVNDFDAAWIIGGSGTSAPTYPSYGTAYSIDIANSRQVGDKVYNFGASADVNFNVGPDPSKSGGKVDIKVNPFNRA
jgi:hypothetical protein